MPRNDDPSIIDLIRREADNAEANQNPVVAHDLREVADKVEGAKNGTPREERRS